MIYCIYHDEPLGFKKNLVASATKTYLWDPLEEIDLGEETNKILTCISSNTDPGLRKKVINLLR